MDRGPLIGILAVGAIGVGVAALAAWQVSIPPALDEAPTERATIPAATATAPIEPPPRSEASVEPQPQPQDEGRSRARSRTREPRRASPLDPAIAEAEQVFAHPLFADVPPDGAEADFTQAISERLADIDRLAEELQDTASDDPELISDAYHHTAHLYDRVAEQLPPPPPPYLKGSELDGWAERQDEMIRGLREKAESLREDATLAAQQD